jgi:hypothetical protein
MTDLLQIAIKQANTLPDKEQNDIAALMLNAIAKKTKKRPLGLAKGLGQVPNDFNDPLPDEELALWYQSQPGDPLNE